MARGKAQEACSHLGGARIKVPRPCKHIPSSPGQVRYVLLHVRPGSMRDDTGSVGAEFPRCGRRVA